MSASNVRVHLNKDLFYKYFVCRPFSKASQELLNAKDRLKARIAAIAFGIFTLGIGIVVCRCYYYDQKIITFPHLLKIQKDQIAKKFSGSDENKIKLINSFCSVPAMGSRFNLVKFKQLYDVIKSVEAEEAIGDFCLKNKDLIKRGLLPYICAFEVLELLMSDGKNKYEKIEALEAGLLQRASMQAYRECLVDALIKNGSPRIVEKLLQSKNEEQEAFFESFFNACFTKETRRFDLQKFISVYSLIREVSCVNDYPNYLLTKVQGSNLNKKIRILAFAYEMLSRIDIHKSNLAPLFDLVDRAVENLGPINYNEQEFLRNCLYPAIPHRKINMIISFLIVEKGSPLHTSERRKKEECAKVIFQLGSVKKFFHEKVIPKVRVNPEKLIEVTKNLFKNGGALKFKEDFVSKIDQLLPNLEKLRIKIRNEYGRFCDIDLREEEKDKLFEYLSKENADLKGITFHKPGMLQFSLKINKIGNK